jgi:hypothetical protein
VQPGTDAKGLRDFRDTLQALATLDGEIKHRKEVEDPLNYGLPDLLRPKSPDETDIQFKARQNRELKDLMENKLWFSKDARRVEIRLAPQMIDFIADLFYRRTQQAILWKGRGSGGSLSSAILIWLSIVYHKMSFTMMAGSQEQAKQVYHYTKSFWECFPSFAKAILDGEPLQTETRLINGVLLKIISASEKQARGKHNPGFVVDESCQEGENTDRMISAAMQGAMSEPNFMVLALSTFHHPIGLFQELWDFADERGFSRYNWNVYDAMAKCDAGMETATAEDPKALKFCRTQCPLTERAPVFDDQGVQTGWKFKGCNGKARDSQGFLPRKNVIIAKKMNRGTNVFEIEYENTRPNWMRPVYDVEWIERTLVEPDWPPPGTKFLEKSVGIDWGLEGQTALIFSALLEIPNPSSPEEAVAFKFMKSPPSVKCVGILEAEFMTGKLTSETIRILMGWIEKYGQDNFHVYADASHPFNNLEVEQVGLDMNRVLFAKWKDYGIGSCTKYFTSPGRLFIRSNLTGFTEQLKRYRQDKYGKPVKKDDHGPDAMLCAMLHFPFEEKFAQDLEPTDEELDGTMMNLIPKPIAPGFEGIIAPGTAEIHVPQAPAKQLHIVRTKRTSDGQVVVM